MFKRCIEEVQNTSRRRLAPETLEHVLLKISLTVANKICLRRFQDVQKTSVRCHDVWWVSSAKIRQNHII